MGQQPPLKCMKRDVGLGWRILIGLYICSWGKKMNDNNAFGLRQNVASFSKRFWQKGNNNNRNFVAGHRGVSIVEFAIVFPVLLFLIIVVVDLCQVTWTRNVITTAMIEGLKSINYPQTGYYIDGANIPDISTVTDTMDRDGVLARVEQGLAKYQLGSVKFDNIQHVDLDSGALTGTSKFAYLPPGFVAYHSAQGATTQKVFANKACTEGVPTGSGASIEPGQAVTKSSIERCKDIQVTYSGPATDLFKRQALRDLADKYPTEIKAFATIPTLLMGKVKVELSVSGFPLRQTALMEMPKKCYWTVAHTVLDSPGDFDEISNTVTNSIPVAVFPELKDKRLTCSITNDMFKHTGSLASSSTYPPINNNFAIDENCNKISLLDTAVYKNCGVVAVKHQLWNCYFNVSHQVSGTGTEYDDPPAASSSMGGGISNWYPESNNSTAKSQASCTVGKTLANVMSLKQNGALKPSANTSSNNVPAAGSYVVDKACGANIVVNGARWKNCGTFTATHTIFEPYWDVLHVKGCTGTTEDTNKIAIADTADQPPATFNVRPSCISDASLKTGAYSGTPNVSKSAKWKQCGTKTGTYSWRRGGYTTVTHRYPLPLYRVTFSQQTTEGTQEDTTLAPNYGGSYPACLANNWASLRSNYGSGVIIDGSCNRVTNSSDVCWNTPLDATVTVRMYEPYWSMRHYNTGWYDYENAQVVLHKGSNTPACLVESLVQANQTLGAKSAGSRPNYNFTSSCATTSLGGTYRWKYQGESTAEHTWYTLSCNCEDTWDGGCDRGQQYEYDHIYSNTRSDGLICRGTATCHRHVCKACYYHYTWYQPGVAWSQPNNTQAVYVDFNALVSNSCSFTACNFNCEWWDIGCWIGQAGCTIASMFVCVNSIIDGAVTSLLEVGFGAHSWLQSSQQLYNNCPNAYATCGAKLNEWVGRDGPDSAHYYNFDAYCTPLSDVSNYRYGGDAWDQSYMNMALQVAKIVLITVLLLLWARFPYLGQSPISLVWDPSLDINNLALKDLTHFRPAMQIEQVVEFNKFPIDPSAKDKWTLWRGSASSPLLVFDPEHKGKIEKADQLFGNFTFGKRWLHGYEALASLDKNKDAMITGNELKDLALWFDVNSDGVSQPGEVVTLSQAGVTKLSVAVDTFSLEKMAIGSTQGYERVVDDKTVGGETYDWLTIPFDDRVSADTFAKEQYREASQAAIGQIKAGGLAPADPKKEFTGKWEWVADKAMSTPVGNVLFNGKFALMETAEGIYGTSSSNLPAEDPTKKDGKVITNTVPLSGDKEIDAKGSIRMRFNTKTKNGQNAHSTAVLLPDGKTMRGESRIEAMKDPKSGDIFVVYYTWTAKRMEEK